MKEIFVQGKNDTQMLFHVHFVIDMKMNQAFSLDLQDPTYYLRPYY
jgi:hypothetical protein